MTDDIREATFSELGVYQGATFSEDGVYRYELDRRWGDGDKLISWIMLNPSTADEFQDDATIRRCIAYSRLWGFDRLRIFNLFALRSTDPKALRTHKQPHGEFTEGGERKNDLYILTGCGETVIAAWGNHGARNAEGDRMRHMLHARGVTLQSLAVTKQGEPGHPLYIKGTVRPTVLPPLPE